MMDSELSIHHTLDQLALAVQADFIAVAFRERSRNQYCWKFIHGSQSDRIDLMFFRQGQGIGGITMQIG